MGQRLNLHQKLIDVTGTANVYFQPPSNIQMKYPCVVYKRNREAPKYADNCVYSNLKCYAVTYITLDPDSDVPDKIGRIPFSRFTQHFVADNLNHDVYDIYF